VDSLHDVPSPFSRSGLSRAKFEVLPIELFGEITTVNPMNGELREEIARLKGLKGSPDFRPRGMDKGTGTSKPDRLKKQQGRVKLTR
jgi:hypothetical protein